MLGQLILKVPRKGGYEQPSQELEVASWVPFLTHKGWVLSAWTGMFWGAVLTVPPRLSQSWEATLTVLPLLCSADDEAMATEVTPPASAELTELGKCLMTQEVREQALISPTLSLCSVSRLPVVQPDAATDCWAAGAFPSVRIFSWEHTWVF